MEAQPTPGVAPATDPAGLAAEIDRIDAAVSRGEADLAGLGFWRVVARVKRDPVLVAEHADRIGAIDTAAFHAGVRLRFPVWLGNAAMLALVVGGAVALVIAASAQGTFAGLALLAAAIAWAIGVHSPTHWAFGWLAGIRFTDYFLGGPPPPRPGIKTDYASYLRAEASMRAWFHASGAIATKLAPFVALALSPVTNAPAWAVLATAGFGLVQIVTDATLSTRSSDWKKFRRERAIAKRGR